MPEAVTAPIVTPAVPFTLACPACRTPLEVNQDQAVCLACRVVYPCQDGVWRLLAPGRADHYARFTREYQAIRRAEGWGNDDPAYYRALPWRDLGGRHPDLWRIRAASFRTFLDQVVAPLERAQGRPLKVVDLGAGNGWLAYRLAQRGHAVAAVDLGADAFDGVGAVVHYDTPFTPLQAEVDRLPLADGQMDLAVFNASLHYSTSYDTTLAEALRVLRPEGRLVILDSPLYRDPSSGARMVQEREAQFRRTYGLASNALPCEHYLTPQRLAELGATLGLRWRRLNPAYGWRWTLRRLVGRVRARREPATFCVIVGERAGEGA